MTDFGVNQGLVEEMFLAYCQNPGAIPEEWKAYFEGLPPSDLPELTSAGAIAAPSAQEVSPITPSNGHLPVPSPGENGHVGFGSATYGLRPSAFLPLTSENVPFLDRRSPSRERRGTSFPPTDDVLQANELQGRVSALVNAYRVRGHLFARLDPLGLRGRPADELLLERYGLADVDPETIFSTGDMAGPPSASLQDIRDRLQETYCRTIGVEFTFIEGSDVRSWLQGEMESTGNRLTLTHDEQIRILTKLTDAEIFEQFLHKNYVGAKRFSLEGAESFIPFVDLLIEESAERGVSEIVIGMAHRGRLNLLANIMGKRFHEIFADFEDVAAEAMLGGGDVKYHMGYSTDRKTQSGAEVHLTLSFNPSHLEFVAPVVEGRVRAKQARLGDDRTKVLPLIIHGDAAFAGQGIVAETLNLAGLEGYATGGTIHVVINNQVGFTTLPYESRTTRYCTDVARMLRCPVFHVNGEDPEAVAQVAHLATDFRQKFKRDVIIDLYCYRKYGHNEGDEPRFTQPIMYQAVDSKKKTVREAYVETLVAGGQITEETANEIEENRRVELEAALRETRSNGIEYAGHTSSMGGIWGKYKGGTDLETPDVDTSLPREELVRLVERTNHIPEGFGAHKKIRRLYQQRIDAAKSGKPFDWGTAETLAFASLVATGTRVRLSGQDAERGTFSHRHAVIFDQEKGTKYTPLSNLEEGQATFEVINSPLSEAGVLGFDYGFSLDSPDALVIWEAQFGDFVNGAQVIIDQFIFSSEDKWDRLSGLVMLLPHGFEGQGPEHSSARLERFLNQCAEDNLQVVNLTTPAQIFHCLRRQVERAWRKPLIVMSPKSLLRHPQARSTLDDLSSGGFQRVIPDPTATKKKTKRVLLCSGKVYYELLAERETRGREDVALVRIEQLYPLRAEELKSTFAPFNKNVEFVWVQEEPWNMGAWYFLNARVPQMIERKLHCVAREESASPATGSKGAHKIEQAELMDRAYGPLG